MVEVGYFARIAKLSTKENAAQAEKRRVSIRCPAAAAEIFHPRVRRNHLRSQSQRTNVAEYRAGRAHEIGLPSNATMLYGHVETEEERVDHLVKLRELAGRGRMGSWRLSRWRFIRTTPALSHIPKPTGYADLRNIAVSAAAAR